MARIYLDNAATSWPKPERVYQAIDDYLRRLGAPAGRGSYAEATEVDRIVSRTRLGLARLIEAATPDSIVFTYSGTDSLNLALSGILSDGDHVVTTDCEHNSVLRPLRHLEDKRRISVTRVGCDDDGFVDSQQILQAVRPETKLVAIMHASNVTGAVQPVETVCQELRQHAAITLVDAAQTIGHRQVSVADIGCDLLAAPAHKGLLGPTGTGFLYVDPRITDQLQPLRLGGTGTSSESDQPPEEVPDRFEAGNLNVLGIIGIGAGIADICEQTLVSLEGHEQQLTQRLLNGLIAMPNITIYGPRPGDLRRVGVVSFTMDDYSPFEVAELLDQMGSVQVRAGFHCAPRMHQRLKTDTMGGAVRVSVGFANTDTDIDTLLAVLAQLS